MFTKAALIIRPAQYAGQAETVAIQARKAIDAARVYRDGSLAAKVLRTLADVNSDAIPDSLWRSLLRAADVLSR